MSEEFKDLTKLTEEQQAAIQEFLYKTYCERPSDDNTQFVVPFIAMNDGQTPAQIRSKSQGLYKDIQRSPFIRKTGVFTEDNRIEDIDITALVYYGTLQQAKIAPTLENVDIKLYIREPSLRKEKSSDPRNGIYADTYIWREIPAGFHVYNNDTVYGFEWLILQDNYAGTNGIYNLHMNVEDGIGACKFAGTQAPINLAGVQYKLVVTAKNLWSREFSLLDSMPLLHNLNANSDSLAPSVNAVKEYYAKALETLKVITKELYVPNDEKPVFFANEEGVVISDLTLGEIENLEAYVTTLRNEYDAHSGLLVENAAYDEGDKVHGPHGIANAGFKGNIAARSLDGLTLSNGKQAITKDVEEKFAYIPFVDNDNSIGLGSKINYLDRGAGKNPSLLYSRSFEALKNKKLLNIVDISGQDELEAILHSTSVGTTVFNSRIGTENGKVTLKLTSGASEAGAVTLKVDTVATKAVDLGNDVIIDSKWVMYQHASSSIAYKIPRTELLPIFARDALGADLEPNIGRDQDGMDVGTLDTSTIPGTELSVLPKEFKDGKFTKTDAAALDKLGSALQALHELPLGIYEYKRGQDSYKEQLGIFVERVNQFRDNLMQLSGSGEKANSNLPADDNYLVHKRTQALTSYNDKIVNSAEGYDAQIENSDQGNVFTERVENNAYTYTEEEIKSIAHYLDLMTGKKELNHEIRNTVGILLKAAQETQDRLLDVETAIYGYDAATLPGSDEAKQKFVEDHIDERLQSILDSSPLLLGLNRLMRAICLELYDTTDLEHIDAEIRSVVRDSDSLESKVTVKSRVDQIDELLSEITNQTSALTHYYLENIQNDESQHTYTPIYDSEDKVPVTHSSEYANQDRKDKDGKVSQETTEGDLLTNLEDNHSGTVKVDHNRKWKTLPATEDVTEEAKATVKFAKVADSAYRHTPNKDESGSVRVPAFEEIVHKDVDKDGNERTRTWKQLKVEKNKETGSYQPVYETKAVAWDAAKLERINKKVSEITKTIYGIDDVTASLPNRTEVIRRNITNLIDDLYPNRSFSIENPVKIEGLAEGEYEDIRTPFKTSRVQDGTGDSVVELQSDETERQHTSIISWIDSELFNFTLGCNLIAKRRGSEDTTLDIIKPYHDNHQITLDTKAGAIVFDTSKLVTDEESFDADNYGTYKDAYSRLDVLSDLIGVEDCYLNDKLFFSNILDAVGITVDNGSVLNNPAGYTDAVAYDPLPDYLNELSFKSLRPLVDVEAKATTNDDNLAESIMLASDVDYVLSRKNKTMQQRITTLEAFADELAKGLHFVDRTHDSYTKVDQPNTRFESQDALGSLTHIANEVNDQLTEPLLFDFDLADSYETKDTKSTSMLDHNKTVWDIVKSSVGVRKLTQYQKVTDYGTGIGVSAKYTIEGTLVREIRNDGKNGKEELKSIPERNKKWIIQIVYVDKDSTDLETLQSDPAYATTIYLKAKETTTKLGNFASTEAVTDQTIGNFIEGADGWQNQTEYNIYKTINNLFASLLTHPGKKITKDSPEAKDCIYYQMMLKAHPVGSLFSTRDKNFNPEFEFGGTWVAVAANNMIATGTPTAIAPASENFGISVSGSGTGTGSIGDHTHQYWDSDDVRFTENDHLRTTGGASATASVSVSVNSSGNISSTRFYSWVRTGK